MPCVHIDRIEFDQQSRIELSNIARKLKLYKYLKASMIGGTLITVLNGKSLNAIHTNIKTTDFQALGQALSAVANVQKADLHQIAALQVLGRIPSINRTFWENIAYGCKRR